LDFSFSTSRYGLQMIKMERTHSIDYTRQV
jgi:hypothetical protein